MTRQEAIVFLSEHGKRLLGDKRFGLVSGFAVYGDWGGAAELIAGDESDHLLNMLADAIWEGKK